MSKINTHRAAKLPALPGVRTDNPALNAWIDAVRERLEVREGSRGDPWERAVTLRDLDSAGVPIGGLTRRSAFGGQGGFNGGGGGGGGTDGGQGAGGINVDGLLGGSLLFTDLLKEVQRLRSGDDLPSRVKDLIVVSIEEEARKRGADIRSVTHLLQSEVESFAGKVDEITASVAGAQSGIRQLSYASTTENNATAGRLTTLVAALDGVGSSSFSESIQVIADRITGLRSTWMLQVNAGGAVSGISLLASEDPDGVTRSAFVVEADQFVVAAPVNFATATTPTATAIGQIWFNTTTKDYKRATSTGTAGWVPYVPAAPFGVDTTTGTIYINGKLRVNAGGGSLQDLALEAGRYVAYIFIRSSTGVPPTPVGPNPPGFTAWRDSPPVSTVETGVLPLYMSKATRNLDGSLVGVWSTPVRIDGATGPDGKTVEFQYALSNFAAAPPETGWTGNPPFVGAGEFLWMRTRVIEPNSGPVAWSPAVRISGEAGTPGAAGARGSLIGYGARYGIVSFTWNDAQANAVIFNLLNGTSLGSQASIAHLRPGDTVTLSNGVNFAATRYWGGSAWLIPGVVIDGNLLVSGSITADRIDTRGLSIKDNAGNVILSSDAQLGTTYIKNAAIGTLQLGANAVTEVYSASSPGPFNIAVLVNTGAQTYLAVTVPHPATTAVSGYVTCTIDPSSVLLFTLSIVRGADGFVLASRAVNSSTLSSFAQAANGGWHVTMSFQSAWEGETTYELRVTNITTQAILTNTQLIVTLNKR